jgi:hypothetical protein
MTAPIFNFRNVKIRLTTASATTVYSVLPYSSGSPSTTLPSGVINTEVSAIVLTMQCANITGSTGSNLLAANVLVTASVTNSATLATNLLVSNYPVVPYNAFDPLSGNLILTANDILQVTTDTPNGVDVIISLLEVANAPTS